MADLVRVIFYTWLIASTVALVVYRRRKAAERRVAEEGPTVPPNLQLHDDARAVPSAPVADRGDLLTGSRPASPVVPQEVLSERPTSESDTSSNRSEPTVEAVGTSGGDVAAASGRRGLFAAETEDAPRTIAEALEGVSWPCGLVPVIRAQDIHQVDRRVVFSTVGVPAAEVGRQVADRMEEAGFAVSSLDDVTALARRGGTAVAMVLHPAAEQVLNDGHPEFPTLPPDSVVLVCDLRYTSA